MNAEFIPIFVKMEQHVWTTRWETIHVSVSTDGRGGTAASTSTTVRTTLVITGEHVTTKWGTTTATVPTEKQVLSHFLPFSWQWYFQWNCCKKWWNSQISSHSLPFGKKLPDKKNYVILNFYFHYLENDFRILNAHVI